MDCAECAFYLLRCLQSITLEPLESLIAAGSCHVSCHADPMAGPQPVSEV